MQIAIIELGRIDGNIVRRLLRAEHSCVVYDAEAAQALATAGAIPASSLADVTARLTETSCMTWIVLPSVVITEAAVTTLGGLMSAGDVLIDSDCSNFKGDAQCAANPAERGVRYLNVGTSGGVWRLEREYCLMIDGERSAFEHLNPIFAALAPGIGDTPRTEQHLETVAMRDRRAEQGHLYVGLSSARHFVKMIYNGIKYGMMQAIAEGFDILRNHALPSPPEAKHYDLNLTDLFKVWRRGSVVTSWLLDPSVSASVHDPGLNSFFSHVEDSGKGRWTIKAVIKQAVPADVLSAMCLGFGGQVETLKA